MTERDVKELLGHMVLQLREAEMLIESLRAENAQLKKSAMKKSAEETES